jgi:hypothetical protein
MNALGPVMDEENVGTSPLELLCDRKPSALKDTYSHSSSGSALRDQPLSATRASSATSTAVIPTLGVQLIGFSSAAFPNLRIARRSFVASLVERLIEVPARDDLHLLLVPRDDPNIQAIFPFGPVVPISQMSALEKGDDL